MTADPDPSTDWARPLHERKIATLGRLAEIAMGIATLIEAQAQDAAGAGQPIPERTVMDFSRIARAVRLTLMLQTRLIQDLEDRDRQVADRRASQRVTQAFHQQERVAGIVERIAEADPNETRDVERLVWEARERLDQDDLYGDILARPVSELIAMICEDLGLDPDWPSLSEEAWAREEIAAGDPGWPLADHPAFKRHAASP